MTTLHEQLADFAKQKKFQSRKGPLCVALVVTNHAIQHGLPLDPDSLLTPRGGQVKGLGKSAVQAILARHDITRILAEEGGRTSRGSIENMTKYASFLNGLHDSGAAHLEKIEAFWIQEVLDFFARHPFKLSLDSSLSLKAQITNLLEQAENRSRETGGMHYQGALLQHLVGAKLETVLPQVQIDHHSFSTADAQSGRPGDFLVGNVAIHVTTSPGDSVILRCEQNLAQALRPIIVTVKSKSVVAEGLAENRNLHDRIDVFDIQQFLATNLYEIGGFAIEGHKAAIDTLLSHYNSIVDRVETDPSLRVELV